MRATKLIITDHVKNNSVFVITAVIVLSILISAVLGWTVYNQQKKSVQERVLTELDLVNTYKGREISNWINNKIEIRFHAFNSPHIVNIIDEYVQNPTKSFSSELTYLIDRIQNTDSLRSITLIDRNGKPQFTTAKSPDIFDEHKTEFIKKVFETKKRILTDLYFCENENSIYFSAYIPVIKRTLNDTTVIAVVLIDFDPHKTIYPLIKQMPFESETAESFIVSPNGTYVNFLSDLRFAANPTLSIKKSFSNWEMLGVKAVNGIIGPVEGLDYRGEEVFGAVCKIHNTDWYLIVKRDKKEVFQQLNERTLAVSLIALVLFASIGFSIFSFTRKTKLAYFKDLYQRELEKKTLATHYEQFLKHANDIILLINKEGYIVEANRMALKVYGYTQNEITGMYANNLRADSSEEDYKSTLRKATSLGGTVIRINHKKKNGEVFPVEASINLISIDNKTYFQSIIRDISDRVEAEKKLIESENRYRSLIENAPTAIAISREMKFVYANPAFIKIFGYNAAEELINESLTKTISPKNLNEFVNRAQNREKGLPAENEYETVGLKKDGSEFYVHCSITRVELNDGPATLGLFTNITQRKKAEQQLQENERKLATLFGNLPGMAYRCLNNKDWTMEFVSEGCKKLTGYTSDYLIHNKILYNDLILPEDREFVWNEIQKALDRNSDFEITYRIKTSDNKIKVVWEKGKGIYNESGSLQALEGFITDITDRKIAEEERDSFFNLSLDLLCIANTDGYFLRLNPSWKKTLDFTNEELMSKTFLEFVHPDDRASTLNAMEKLSEGNTVINFVNRYLCKDGSYRWFSWVSSPKDKLIYAVAHDITEHKKAELALKESEERIRFINNNIETSLIYQIAIYKNGERKFTYLSNNVERLHGITAAEGMADANLLYSQIYKDDIDKLALEEEKSIRTVSKFDCELRFINQNGEIRWSHIVSYPIQMEDGTIIFNGIESDITDSKKAEEALLASENKMRSIIEGTPYLFFYTQDTNGDMTYVSPTVEQITGHTVEKWLKTRDWFITESEINQYAKERTHAHLRGEVTEGSILVDIRHADGRPITLRIFENPIFKDGTVIGLQGVAHDITEQINAEKQIREIQKRYRTVVENAVEIIYTTDESGNFNYANEAALHTSGYSMDELLQKNYLDIILPEYRNKVRRVYQKQFLKKETTSYAEYPFQIKSGDVRWFSQNARLIMENDVVKGFYVIARDITEQRVIEQALLESEEKYRKIFENVQDVFFITDTNGILTDISPSIERHTGYPFEEIIGKHVDEHYYKKEDRKRFLNEIRKTGEVNDFETQMVTYTGKIIYVSMNAHYRYDSEGKIIGMEGSLRDITARKETEKLLHDQTKLLTSMLNILPIGIWIVDKTGKIIHGNPAGQKIWAGAKYVGVDQFGEYKGWWLNTGELIKPDEWAAARAISKKETSINEEIEIECFDGTHKIILNSAIPIIHSDGQVEAAIIVNQDITERKKSEITLKESESKFRVLSETTSSAIFMFRGEQMIYANPAAEKLSGYKIDEIKKMKFWDIVHPEFKSMVINRGLARQSGEKVPERYEIKIIRKDGSERWVDFSGGIIRYEGKPTVLGTAFDITERKRAELALTESETKFRVLSETAASAIFIYKGNKFCYTNPAGEQLSGYSANELYEKDFWDIVHPEFQVMIKERGLARQRGENVPNRYEFKIVRKDGIERWIDFTSGMINFNGSPAALGTAFDITERKIVEEALSESEKKYRQLFDSNPHPMWVYDLESLQFLAVNEAAEIHYGYSKDEFLNMTIKDIRPAEDVARLLSSINDYIGVDYAGVWRHIKKDGTLIYVDIISHSLTFDGRKADLVLSMDVTEKLKAQEENIKLSRAVEQSPAAIVITNTEGLIEYVNPRYEQLTGYTLDEVRGKKTNVLKSGYTTDEEYKKLWDTIKSGKEWRGEFHNKKKNGELFWASVLISPIINGGGLVKNFIAIKEDITERKKLMAELVEAKELAEKSDQLKSEFLAQMSHEIRTPLNAVLNFSSLITEELNDIGLANDIIEESLSGVQFSGKRIIRTVELILNASELHTGSYELLNSNFNIYNDVLKNIITEFNSFAIEKKLHFTIEQNIEDDLIYADKYSVEQIFVNLIDNAIKYTRAGFVKVNIYKDHKPNIMVSVEDSGIGISEEYQEIMFKPFTQEEQGYSRTFEGNGLGLTVVKKYCELNNIELTVETEKGKGTKFNLIFPLNNNLPSYP